MCCHDGGAPTRWWSRPSSQNKAAPAVLDRGAYLHLERPSENVSVKYFGKFDEVGMP
ncbi:COX aromatic rich motif-containing protein [Tardiphaga sp. 862_B3_N4_1]|uniref:COX aromatic rich motif-containing protein n=1 Tax=Tardiphaga sp. 862_B3_N4_1 TaxID=3240764 RepID=UPI003F244A11